MTNILKSGPSGEARDPRFRGRAFSRALLCLSLIFALTAALALPVFAETTYPKPTDYIADDAAILSESTVREIKEKNDTLISEVKAVIAVCTVKTTNGVDIGKYARSVYTEWQLPAGVLILIASDDNAFYLVQSSSIGDKITNEALEGIRDREIEEDFAAGNIDRAVRKAVSQLSILMLRELKTEEAETPAESAAASSSSGNAAQNNASTGTDENGKTSISRIVVTVLKVLLALVILFVVVFVILFVAAMFNDDAAAFMQRTFFRKNARQRLAAEDIYDDRLYNDGRQNPRQGQNRPRPTNQQNPYGQGQNRQPYQQQVPGRPVQQYPAGQQIRNQQYGQYGGQYGGQNGGQYGSQYGNQYNGQYSGQYPAQTAQQPRNPQAVQQQYRQYPQQAAQQQYPQQRQPQQYANQYGFPIQSQPAQRRTQSQQQARSSQPYSAESDPNLARQRQAQNGDPSATQTYTIPGRGGY